MDSQEGLSPIVGVFVRYVDQFNHYKVRFDFTKKEVMIARCTSMSYTLMMLEKMPSLSLNVNVRVVVQFVLYTIKVWVHEDEGGHSPDLDEGKREAEFNYTNDKLGMLPFTR